MPTLYFPCPQCDRPLDADPSLDGPTVQCPCCDRVVEVPNPRALGRPVVVWLAAILTALVPASWAPALLVVTEILPPVAALGVPAVVGLGTIVCLLPAIALWRGKRAGWGWALGVSLASVAVGVAGFTMGIPFIMVLGVDTVIFVYGLLIAVTSAALILLLILPVLRAWCDR
jgi:hypothetical protein